ncbi:MAG: hypothetical protein HY402_02095 [Elusimicrobia bacterium]|nr:hypothetical protein [Elusimicrobiota bacterium]
MRERFAELWRKRWFRAASAVFFCAACVYGMVFVDLWFRARSAYLEGEKYWDWHFYPEKKKRHYEGWFQKELQKLQGRLKSGELEEEAFQREQELLEFRREEFLRESSIKYAYVWYQTAVELFSPPRSRWVELSRGKMPQTKELWKEELRRQKIPFEEYMLR